MNKLSIAICLGVILFAGCREHSIPIDFGQVSATKTETTYMLSASAIPPADPHNVLIEEFTGQDCDICPSAHTILEGIEANGQVNVIGLYITNFNQTEPPKGALYDFRHATATLIGNNIYGGISAMPQGGIDRVPSGGSLLLGRSIWSSAVNDQKLVKDPLNLSVLSSFTGGIATITATVTYLQTMSTKQNLTIVIVEDSIIDKQLTPTGVDNNYLFTDVFRDMITAAPLGDAILDTMAVKQVGRVYSRIYKYTPPLMTPAINPAHCRVIAFVNAPGGTSGDFHVYQSVQTKMAP